MAGVCQVISVSPRALSESLGQVISNMKNILQGVDPQFQLPGGDLTGKVAVVTGSNTGIGRETAKGLADRGATVIMACRNVEKAREAANMIGGNIKVRRLDLASFSSVRDFCRQVSLEEEKIDLLINNAGMFSMERSLTEDNQEMQFQVNHLGPFLLTNLLLDKLKAAKAARIINVSSIAHWAATSFPFEDLTWSKSVWYNGIYVYALTKLANILFTTELARRLTDSTVRVFSLHPGGVSTDLGRNVAGKLPEFVTRMMGQLGGMMTLSPEMGARTSLYCALEPSLSDQQYSGLYFDNCKVGRTSSAAKDEGMAKRLWDVSSEIVNLDR